MRKRTVIAPQPRYLPTLAAASYCSISRWGLIRAYRRGELAPAGRRGRTFTWDIEALDAWMRGAPVPEDGSR